jgi:hypothetical protein
VWASLASLAMLLVSGDGWIDYMTAAALAT